MKEGLGGEKAGYSKNLCFYDGLVMRGKDQSRSNNSRWKLCTNSAYLGKIAFLLLCLSFIILQIMSFTR